MNFRTHTDGPVDVNGCSLQGTIQASVLSLTGAFNRPQASDLDEGHYEWRVLFEDGTVATIYDWNIGHQPLPGEVVSWHIGGRSRAAAELVHNTYRNGPGVSLRRVA